jgi:hypothetical protein
MKAGPGAIRDIDETSAIQIHIVGLNHLLGPISFPCCLRRSRDIITDLSGFKGVRNIDDS